MRLFAHPFIRTYSDYTEETLEKYISFFAIFLIFSSERKNSRARETLFLSWGAACFGPLEPEPLPSKKKPVPLQKKNMSRQNYAAP